MHKHVVIMYCIDHIHFYNVHINTVYAKTHSYLIPSYYGKSTMMT